MPGTRFLKSSWLYPSYLRLFHAARPGLAGESFSRQMEAVLADVFGFGDAWKHYLELGGRYEVMETVINNEPAQKAWARERGLRHSETNWSEEILTAQLAEFKPEIWFCNAVLPVEQVGRLRKSCPSIRFVIGVDGAMKHDAGALAECDAVLSCVRESAAFYSRAGLKGYWLPWGFDPRVGARLAPVAARSGVTFCGTISFRDDRYFGRAELLKSLGSEFDLRIYVDDLTGWNVERQMLSAFRHHQHALGWRVLKLYPALRRLKSVNGGGRYGRAMYQTLAESLITLNMHGDAVETAVNIRLFEATGVGVCLLTDWKDDLPALFEPDREVVAYRSGEECREKLRYLLEHDRERESIVAAGRKRCLRDHNLGAHILAFASEVLNLV